MIVSLERKRERAWKRWKKKEVKGSSKWTVIKGGRIRQVEWDIREDRGVEEKLEIKVDQISDRCGVKKKGKEKIKGGKREIGGIRSVRKKEKRREEG